MKFCPSRLVLALSAGLFFSANSYAEEPVAKVNSTDIPAARADVMLSEQFSQGMEDSSELREAVREELIRREILTQAAVSEGLDQKQDVKEQMELARQAILIRAYLRDFTERHPVTDEEIAETYETLKPQLGGGKEYKASHILLETRDEAVEVIERLEGGEDFAELAGELSQDPGSRDRGGDLGWNDAEMFVGPFASALQSMQSGERTDTPVQSEFGYHVIRVEDIRDAEPPTLEEVSEQIRQRLQQQRIEEHMVTLREEAEIDN